MPEDNAKGLSTFTIMAGLGGFMGYSLGATDWEGTAIGEFFGGQVRTVFAIITVIFFFCVFVTVTSFSEIPLPLLEELNYEQEELNHPPRPGSIKRHSEDAPISKEAMGYGSLDDSEAREKSRVGQLIISSFVVHHHNPLSLVGFSTLHDAGNDSPGDKIRNG